MEAARRSMTLCKCRTAITTIIITSPWSGNGSIDQEFLHVVWNLNAQCSACKSATGLRPDGIHTTTTLRKNSFNIITVVIPCKARHSKPSTPFTPFSIFHVNSIHFRLSHCCYPCQKIFFCHKSGTCFRDKPIWGHKHSCAHIFNVKIMAYWQSTLTQLSQFSSFQRPFHVMNCTVKKKTLTWHSWIGRSISLVFPPKH
jgi:hypothetical protein